MACQRGARQQQEVQDHGAGSSKRGRKCLYGCIPLGEFLIESLNGSIKSMTQFFQH